MRRLCALVAAILCVPSVGRAAEWQLKPFAGVTFGGDTTFKPADVDHQAGHAKFAYGVSAVLFGEIFGIEGDLGQTPQYFTGGHLVFSSGVTTATGNVVAALPKRMTKYTLRPYVVGGLGVMHVRTSDFLAAFSLDRTMTVADFGAGATGFLTNRIGINWDVRYFRSVGGTDRGIGLSYGPEQLSFWRTTMGLAIRP